MDVLLQRVGDQRQHLLVLVQQETGSQVPQALVCESRRGQQLDALYLTKVCPLAEGEQVQQLRNIVAPKRCGIAPSISISLSHFLVRAATQMVLSSGVVGGYAPDVVVVALLAEAGSDVGALLLDDSSLVGDGLGRSHVADELLHCGQVSMLAGGGAAGRDRDGTVGSLQELIVTRLVGAL